MMQPFNNHDFEDFNRLFRVNYQVSVGCPNFVSFLGTWYSKSRLFTTAPAAAINCSICKRSVTRGVIKLKGRGRLTTALLKKLSKSSAKQ